MFVGFSTKTILLNAALAFTFVGLSFATFFYIPLVKAQIVANVEICHATGAPENPYVLQNPAANADVSGHDDHTGGIYPVSPWGDIIPPFDYDGGSYPGKNWTTEGEAIYNNECSFPDQLPTVTPTPSPSPTLTPTLTPTPVPTEIPSPTPTLTPTPSPEPSVSVSPTLTPTPQVQGSSTEYDACTNIAGVQSSVPTGWFQNGEGSTECREFQYGDPGDGNPPTGQVLGTSSSTNSTVGGQVLGTSTLAATGKVENIFFVIGLLLLGTSLYGASHSLLKKN